MKHYALGIGAAVLLALGACKTSGDKLVEGGAVPLTQAQTVAHITDKTETWKTGVGYYDPNGTLHVITEGTPGSGTYTVNESGQVCSRVDIWGPETFCHMYVDDNGTVTAIFQGETHVYPIKPGRHI